MFLFCHLWMDQTNIIQAMVHGFLDLVLLLSVKYILQGVTALSTDLLQNGACQQKGLAWAGLQVFYLPVSNLPVGASINQMERLSVSLVDLQKMILYMPAILTVLSKIEVPKKCVSHKVPEKLMSFPTGHFNCLWLVCLYARTVYCSSKSIEEELNFVRKYGG